MDITTLLVIVLLFILLGGGWYGRWTLVLGVEPREVIENVAVGARARPSVANGYETHQVTSCRPRYRGSPRK